MVIGTRGKVLIGAIILVEAVLIVAGLVYRWGINRDFALISGENFDGSAVLEILLENPPFPTSFEGFEILGFLTVSTGRVSQTQLKDRTSGAVLGEATILDTVIRDRSDPDSLIRLPLIVQFAPVNDPGRNVMPWVLAEAAELRSISLDGDSAILSVARVEEIFPRGTGWAFVPLVDLEREELEGLVELSFFARGFYGGSTYPQLEKLFIESPDRHPLLGSVSQPLFVLDTFEYILAR